MAPRKITTVTWALPTHTLVLPMEIGLMEVEAIGYKEYGINGPSAIPNEKGRRIVLRDRMLYNAKPLSEVQTILCKKKKKFENI
jgi:hypothetical protein